MPQDAETMVLEICVDSVESAVAAERGGAQRIELCSDLLEGGITPSHALIAQVRRQIAIDLFVMIRPRGGDFCYTEPELLQMGEDILHARQLGANGIVLGVLDQQARVDVDGTRRLVKKAAPLPVTFHRAIDMTPDPAAALLAVIATGARRVLTSGGAPKADQGLAMAARIVEAAGTRIQVMIGGGVTLQTVVRIAEETGASEFHASLRRASPAPVAFHRPGMHLGEERGREYLRYGVWEEDVRALASALRTIGERRAAATARLAGIHR